MNISSTSSQPAGLIPGTLRDADAALKNRPGAAGAGSEAGASSEFSSLPATASASAPADATEPGFFPSDAQAALQGALKALAANPAAAVAAQAPSNRSAVLGLLEVA